VYGARGLVDSNFGREFRERARVSVPESDTRMRECAGMSLERRIPLGLLWLVELEQELAERCEALWAEPLRPGSLDIGDCRPYRVDGSDAS
jgi:hypothetical protein